VSRTGSLVLILVHSTFRRPPGTRSLRSRSNSGKSSKTTSTLSCSFRKENSSNSCVLLRILSRFVGGLTTTGYLSQYEDDAVKRFPPYWFTLFFLKLIPLAFALTADWTHRFRSQVDRSCQDGYGGCSRIELRLLGCEGTLVSGITRFIPCVLTRAHFEL